MNVSPPRPFAWSWSRLKNWRTCPKRTYHLDIAKDVPEEPSEALVWGKSFHKMMDDRVTKGVHLPSTMSRHDKYPAILHQMLKDNIDVRVELQMALDKSLQPTEWFGPDTWFRGVIDVMALDDKYAVIIDWKTGKRVEPELEQLALFAQLVFSHTDLSTVHTAYHWTQHGENTIKTYTRPDMVGLWSRLLPEVKKMEDAAITLNYPPKHGYLCKAYCPVKSCQFHGKPFR